MRLTAWEEERLLVFTAAELARRHRERGLRLNAPEATALICDAMFEAARSGADYAAVEAAGRAAVRPDEVLPGVAALVGEGARFDEAAPGQLALTREGGHTRRRIIHAGGDATGAEVQRALDNAAALLDIRRNHIALELLHTDGAVTGVLVLNDDGLGIVHAPSVILAANSWRSLASDTPNERRPISTREPVSCGSAKDGAPAGRERETTPTHRALCRSGGKKRVVLPMTPLTVPRPWNFTESCQASPSGTSRSKTPPSERNTPGPP